MSDELSDRHAADNYICWKTMMATIVDSEDGGEAVLPALKANGLGLSEDLTVKGGYFGSCLLKKLPSTQLRIAKLGNKRGVLCLRMVVKCALVSVLNYLTDVESFYSLSAPTGINFTRMTSPKVGGVVFKK